MKLFYVWRSSSYSSFECFPLLLFFSPAIRDERGESPNGRHVFSPVICLLRHALRSTLPSTRYWRVIKPPLTNTQLAVRNNQRPWWSFIYNAEIRYSEEDTGLSIIHTRKEHSTRKRTLEIKFFTHSRWPHIHIFFILLDYSQKTEGI